jgi:hypothetical protein
MDCTTSLTAIPYSGGGTVPLATLAIPYVAGTAVYTYVDSYLKLLASGDITNCPVTSCLLMDSTCSATPPANANFYINAGGSPWDLKAKQNVDAGWAE